MVFSSLLFIFAFLALNLFVYARVSARYRNPVLLGFSLVFYAWGGPKFLFLLVGETFVSWLAALLISRAPSSAARKALLVAHLAILLGLLGVFKYAGFLLGNVQAVFGVPEAIPNFVLPIGISFYTFQLISYVVDVYREQVEAQPRFWKLLLYSSLFHQCIAGPIVRYETIADEIDNRRFTRMGMYVGIRRFSIGLAKKAILANSCAAAVATLLPTGVEELSLQSTAGLWLGMLFYMLQIYLDFSAYSDMAIGMGRMVGFHYLENFNYPYTARSVKDFWSRWHISLSTFFRDYVYIPLGGSRCSTPKIVRNYAVVWSLTGFWHGASWNFVLWGLYYFVFLMLERFVIKGRMPKLIGHAYALLVVFFGWVLFYYTDPAELGCALAGMFGFAGGGLYTKQVGTVFLSNVFLLAFSIVACFPLGKWLRGKLFELASEKPAALLALNVIEVVTPIVLLLLSVVALVGDSYNPFLYFRF